jgi:acetyl esterase/lipase
MRRRLRVPLRIAVLALALLGAPACRVTDVPLWGPAAPPSGAYEVEAIRGVCYRGEADDDPYRHRLDLFLPRGAKDYPVVLLIHGGAWMVGDNRCCGLYSSVGEFLASRGIAAVLPNYRLSPEVKHPEHIRDVARAFAWTRAHIAEYGGRPEQLFVAGHSAGGHLAALLATDETYLKAEGLCAADIRGVITVSGVYRIPDGKVGVRFGGTAPESFRFEEFLPLRRDGSGCAPLAIGPGVPLRLNIFGPPFGDDPQAREAASPVCHVRPGLPPFLIINADRDLPTLAPMAEEFHQALLAQGCDARRLRIDGRNHNSVMFRAIDEADPVGGAILDFIRQNRARGE